MLYIIQSPRSSQVKVSFLCDLPCTSVYLFLIFPEKLYRGKTAAWQKLFLWEKTDESPPKRKCRLFLDEDGCCVFKPIIFILLPFSYYISAATILILFDHFLDLCFWELLRRCTWCWFDVDVCSVHTPCLLYVDKHYIIGKPIWFFFNTQIVKITVFSCATENTSLTIYYIGTGYRG